MSEVIAPYQNPFVLAAADYKRNLDIMEYYLQDCAFYLSRLRNIKFDTAYRYVRKLVDKGGRYEFKDPKIMFLARGENGDRKQVTGTFYKYLTSAIKAEDIIAPTFTTYLNPKVMESPLVAFIDENVAARAVAKKAMFQAKEDGNTVLEKIKQSEQGNKKISNNSISGAHLSPSTPLFNPTGHSTLTSNCRTTAGYGSANNEKLLSGNRHYWEPNIVLNNLVSIARNSDYVKIQAVMDLYGLVYPSVEQTMDCIYRSSRQYWSSTRDMQVIRDFVSVMSPIERAAFVYTGDLYHVKELNDEFMWKFIDELSETGSLEWDNTAEVLSAYPDEFRHLAGQLNVPAFRGKKSADVANGVYGKELQSELLGSVINIRDTVYKYRPFIEAFLVTRNVPASIGCFPTSIRKAALTGDTDSTIFTVQDWVEWHQKRVGFDKKCLAVSASMTFLAAQTITHILAIMSGNAGFEVKRIFQTAMKTEFAFHVFVPTQVAKHYFANKGCTEGVIHLNYELERKGVHLKNSNAPEVVIEESELMMRYIIDTVLAEEKISIFHMLKWMGDIERRIIADVSKGGYEFYRRAQIKQAEAYTKGPTESNYIHFGLWNEVFGPKYGTVPFPPYTAYKVTTDLSTRTKMHTWLDSLEDQELAQRFRIWLRRTGKDYVGTFYVPAEVFLTHKMPEEIMQAIHIRKLVMDSCKVFYLILETLGFYLENKKITHLISDHY